MAAPYLGAKPHRGLREPVLVCQFFVYFSGDKDRHLLPVIKVACDMASSQKLICFTCINVLKNEVVATLNRI